MHYTTSRGPRKFLPHGHRVLRLVKAMRRNRRVSRSRQAERENQPTRLALRLSGDQVDLEQLEAFILDHLDRREIDRRKRARQLSTSGTDGVSTEHRRQQIVLADMLESPVPNRGDTVEGVVCAAQRKFKGPSSDLVVGIIKGLKADGLIYEADDEVLGEPCIVLRAHPSDQKTRGTPHLSKSLPRGSRGAAHSREVRDRLLERKRLHCDSPDATGKAGGPHLTDKQQKIWDMLDGCYMKIEWLADELDIDAQQVRNNKSAMKKLGFVIEHKRTRGYYRPDAPPSDLPA